MNVKLGLIFAIACMLSEVINCDTICEELQRNNHLINFAFTNYVNKDNNPNVNTVKIGHYLGINGNVWSLVIENDTLMVGDRTNITNNEMISTENQNTILSEKNYDFGLSLFDIHNRNFNSYNFNAFLVLVKKSTFYFFYDHPFSRNVINTTPETPNWVLKEWSFAYIADSFRSERPTELGNVRQTLAIFVEQKRSQTNSSLFERTFYRIRFGYSFDNINDIHMLLDERKSLPKFLNEIPKHYYINGILNTFDYNMCYNPEASHSNCTHSAVLLLTVDGIPKYCVTSEESLSGNCEQNNLKTYLSCDWTPTTTQSSSGVSTKSPKKESNKILIYSFLVILMLIILIAIIALIVYCRRKSAKKSDNTSEQIKTDTTTSSDTTVRNELTSDSNQSTGDSQTGEKINQTNKD